MNLINYAQHSGNDRPQITWVNDLLQWPTLAILGKTVFIVVFFVSLFGCELLGLTASPDRINKLFEQHRYREILDTANQQLEKNLPNEAIAYWNGVREKAESAVKRYRPQQITAVNKMVLDHDWQLANPRIALLKRNLPLDNGLTQFLADMEQKRQLRISNVQRELSLLEAQDLISTLSLYSSWVEAEPDNETVQTRSQYEHNRRDRLVSHFSTLSKQAEQSGNATLALRYLLKQSELLSGLDPSHRDALQPKKELLENLIASRSKVRDDTKAADDLVKKQERKIDGFEQYQEYVDAEEWSQANQLLNELLIQWPEDPALMRAKEDLQLQIRTQVGSGKLLAASYFSAGEIEKALRQWRAILPIAPDDEELLLNIKRAEQIQAKVKHLKAER